MWTQSCVRANKVQGQAKIRRKILEGLFQSKKGPKVALLEL